VKKEFAMKLDRVEIVNFRSIANITIELDPACIILVGINESGKSNILRALSLLAQENTPSPADLREISPDEDPVTEAYIRFIFHLEDAEKDQIYKNLKTKVLGHPSKPLLKKGSQKITLEDFCYSRREGLYRVNLMNGVKNASYWLLRSKEFEVEPRWTKTSDKLPPAALVQVQELAKEINLKSFFLVDNATLKEDDRKYLEEVSPEEINDFVGKEIADLVKAKLPECIFWQYDEKNYLPPRINLSQFAASPHICQPLMNMFRLAGIQDIREECDKAKGISAHGLKNLLHRVAFASTKHLHAVWKEYKWVSFELVPNGDNIDIGIKDQFTSFEFSQRSDGFKRFVTFLLMVSTKTKTNLLENALLLVDEPDTSLHPSGARFLRDELIKISQKNRVVFSTHSIHMIDRDSIKRHLIIKKDEEITSTTQATDSNIVDEEVLYNAVGYSIFESLKKKNILFEGWRDKRLYQIALSRIPAEYKYLRTKFSDVGFCHAKGVRDIRTVTPLLELANRECFILSDDDDASKEKQREFNKIRGHGTWKRYSEIWPDVGAITGEDFVKPQAFQPIIKEIREKYTALPDLSDSALSHPKGKIYAINSWLQSKNMDKEASDSILNTMKERIFDNLKPSQIEPRYYQMLGKITDL
jgi:energy-coupling factor transporter ATP-binding protein EcfA2